MQKQPISKPLLLACAAIAALCMIACAKAEPAAPTAEAALEAAAEPADDQTDGYRPVFSDADLDAFWSADSATVVTLDGASSGTVKGEGAAAVEGGVKISQSGTYVLSGTMTDGRIVVSVDSDELTTVVLNGVNIACSTSAPLYLANGDIRLILADGTENVLTDANAYAYADASVEEPNACLYADDNLSISGRGALTVNARFNNGIGSKDELRIASGKIKVTAENNALKGNDCVLIRDGALSLTSKNDGIKSDNTKTPGMGVISIEGGKIDIVCVDDALQAESRVSITGGETTVKADGKRINCDGALDVAAGCLK